MSAARPGRILGLLFAGVLLGALDIAIVGPALPAIQASFGVDARALAWVFNIYILFGLIGAPLLAKLSDRHGRRSVYVVCLAVFASGSLIVAAAPAFGVLLAGRAVQAFGAGGLLPVASAVIADTFPLERRGRALGLIGAVFGLAFVIGPILGGILLQFSWQWLFLVNPPLVVILIALGLKVLPTTTKPGSHRFDWLGALFLSITLAGLAWGVSGLEADAPLASLLSPRIWPLVALAAVAGLVFWRLETRAPDPVFHPELFRSTQLRIVGAIAAATGLVEASMVFLPSLSVRAFNVSPSAASFMLLPLVGALIVGSLASGQLLDRIGAKPVIQLGLAFTVLGLFLFALLPVAFWSFYLSGCLIGLGLAGLLGAPLRFVTLQEAGEGHRGAGQGLLTLFLSIGRMIGAAVIGGIVASSAVSELDGYRHALLYLAIVGSVGILVSLGLRRRIEETPRSA
jgi:EmrB/QacA subfamily drug resistance transporter